MPAYELYVPDLRQLVGRAQRVGEVTVGNGQSEAEEDNGNDYLYILHMVIGENREVIEVRVCRAERAE